MTPLQGTRNPSAPFGAAPAGDGRSARSLLSCKLWRGMGRRWRGMGGMGRPELLSAHRPHQQQGLSGFHETRDPSPGYCQVRGAGCPLGRREFRGFHETRITRHESRPLCFSRDTSHESRLLRFSRCFPASCGAAWGGDGAEWAAAVPPHRQRGLYGFHESRLFRPFPLTGRQTFLLERTRPPNQAFHESRDTNHESRLLRFSRCFPASCGAAWGGDGAAWAATVPPHRQQGLYGFHESRLLRPFPFTGRQTFLLERTRPPNQAFHESRDTKHESRLFFESQLPYPRFPTISRHFPPFPGPPTPLRRSRSASRCAPSAAAPAANRQAQKRIAART